MRLHRARPQGLSLLSAELGPTGHFLGGSQPAPVDAQLFGLLMEMEECDNDLYTLLLLGGASSLPSSSSSAHQRKNLVALQKRIFRVSEWAVSELVSE
jgi:hypothetical protein